jgi:hypothetical protein
MKKSQLKNIIRESIKQLMTEQYTGPGMSVSANNCIGTGNPSGWYFVTIGGSSPQVGDVGHIPPGVIPHSSFSGGVALFIREATAPYGGTGGQAFPIQGTNIDPTTGLYVGWNSPTHPNAYPGGPTWPIDLIPGDGGFGGGGGSCTNGCDPNFWNASTFPTNNQFNCGTPTTGCDQSAWSNYSNWLSTFTSLPNFTSTNPNQPCQFLCQRNTQWSATIQNVGPQWADQLQCKLDIVEALMMTHNCASSSAPAC